MKRGPREVFQRIANWNKLWKRTFIYHGGFKLKGMQDIKEYIGKEEKRPEILML